MSNATTEQTPRKRARISSDVEIIDPATSKKHNEYNLYTGTLASLPPVIRPIADTYFITLSDLFNLFVNNKTRLLRFEDDNFIPKSCRTNFTAGASNLVKGSSEYSELLAQIDTKNKETAAYNRDAVKKVLYLEVDASLTKLHDTFCECLFKLSTMFMHYYFYQKEISTNLLHKLSKDIVSNEPRIVYYLFDNDTIFFNNWYNKRYNVTMAVYHSPPDTSDDEVEQTNTQRTTASNSTISQSANTIILNILPNGSRNIEYYGLTEIEQGQYEFAEHDQPGSGLDVLLANRRMRSTTTASLNDLPFSQTPATNASTAPLNQQPFSTQTAPTQTTASTAPLNQQPFSTQTAPTQTTAPAPAPATPYYHLPAQHRATFSLLMLHITYYSWLKKINLHDEHLKNAELSKLATSLLTADVTNDVAMTIAAQPPANEAIINDLINTKFDALKKQLLKTNKGAQNKAKAKNNKRGETPTRASARKKQKTDKAKTVPPPTNTSSAKRSPKCPPRKNPPPTSAPSPKEQKKQKNRGEHAQGTTPARGSSKKSTPSSKNRNRGRTPTPKRSTRARKSGPNKNTTRSHTNTKTKR
jgi:hypothetical protein